MRNAKEIAYKVTRIECTPSPVEENCGSSPEGLRQAVAYLAHSHKDGRLGFGQVRLHLFNEATGQAVGFADISVTDGEIFLTVPA